MLAFMARDGTAGRRLSLPEAALALGLDEDVLVDLMREAGMKLEGPRDAWVLDAADVEAVATEREKQRERNRRELEKLSEALGDA
jgi:hypothetical protein